MNKKESEFIDKNFNIAPINKKHEIRVMTTTKVDENSVLVDIRKFSLYGKNHDGIKRATPKGIKFKICNITSIIYGLLDILVAYDKLTVSDCSRIKLMLAIGYGD